MEASFADLDAFEQDAQQFPGEDVVLQLDEALLLVVQVGVEN
jgi:hypothetical protein